jgi:hypothetical protein
MYNARVSRWVFLLTAALLAGRAIPAAAQKGQYIGAGGCASSNCHGGTTPAAENVSRILTTEYAIWASQDKHAGAAKVLDNERSKRMAEILGLDNASTDRRCTACHVAGSPEKSRSDGVACEACHGPAEKWLGPHTQANSHAASVAAGMIDTKNLAVRSSICLDCHLGSGDRVVDHELIAAGHPDLQFELDTFSWAQPSHHREPKRAAGNTLPRMRIWAVGQAIRLADGMRQLAQRAETRWPEFAQLECSQCHHDLRAESWRVQRGYPGRRPGTLQINPSVTEVARILSAQSGGQQHAALDAALSKVTALVAERIADGPAIAQAARAVAQQADALARRVEQQDFTPELGRNMVRALVTDIPRISGQGVYAAEQATMSLDSLLAALSGSEQKQQPAMAELYNYLERPSAYNGRDFAAMFRKAAGRID